MGSMGTSPMRGGDTEAHKQLHVMANPGASATLETAQSLSDNRTAATSDEVNRIELLLTQLEARSSALVPYGYWNQPQVQIKKSNPWLIVAALGCIWLSTLALAAAYLSYRHSLSAAERGMAATQLVIPTLPNLQDQKSAASVDHSSKAFVTSSDRLNKVEAALKKSNHDLQQFKSMMNTERAKVAPILPKVESAKRSTEVAAAVGNPLSAPVATPSRNPIAAPPANPVTIPTGNSSLAPSSVKASPEIPYRVLSVKPTDAAIPHKADDGTIDYWLVARGAFKELAKVEPIAIATDGVVVHNLEDGKNYTLTRQGEWRDAEW